MQNNQKISAGYKIIVYSKKIELRPLYQYGLTFACILLYIHY